MEYANAEVDELKENNKACKVKDVETKPRLEKLEKGNDALSNTLSLTLKQRQCVTTLYFTILKKTKEKTQPKLYINV